jgi:hypothetical protein
LVVADGSQLKEAFIKTAQLEKQRIADTGAFWKFLYFNPMHLITDYYCC